MNLEDDNTAKPTQFSNRECTCKSCNHRISSSCMKARCDCCTESNHSMVLDGIQGFAPQPERQQNKDLLDR